MTDSLLLDVSRMVWRRWTHRLPTGIDRVCLAYGAHYAPRARAVLQWRGRAMVASWPASQRLFARLGSDAPGFRAAFAAMLPQLVGSPQRSARYLNVGHTGLNHRGLARWIAGHDLAAVFLLHDAIPITHPQFCRPGEAARHAARLDCALRSGAALIANSHATARAIAHFAGTRDIECPPIVSAWLGSAPTPPAAAMPHGAFVMLGTIEARKNHAMILAIWRALAARRGAATPRLIVIGQRGWLADAVCAELERQPPGSPVAWWRDADDARTHAALAGARALLMPSHAEGFGLPVVEALRLGTPVIASDLPVFREVAGTIPRYCAAGDAAAWTAAITAMLDDPHETARQAHARRTWRAPGWPEHFARVDALLESVAR